jgi:uncharacterized protein YjbJ (UPF0337 family)
MKRWISVMFVGAALLGCGGSQPPQPEGPAEKAGKAVDDAADEVKEKTEDAADKAGDKVEEAGDKVEKATDPDRR